VAKKFSFVNPFSYPVIFNLHDPLESLRIFAQNFNTNCPDSWAITWCKNIAKKSYTLWVCRAHARTDRRQMNGLCHFRLKSDPESIRRSGSPPKVKSLLEGHLLPVPAKFGSRLFPRSSVILFTVQTERSQYVRLVGGGYNDNEK